ncbi:helix-turn-helix domain-containing protein [Pelagibius sp.]|uniref:helix-turn-helix domain-containing protein n=1 Tax=Pelagibius sp. TaxID=1931238 RepID=UPI00260F405C|nr:helix-turn-helix domain-containing protein [Pelagibius sp.]
MYPTAILRGLRPEELRLLAQAHDDQAEALRAAAERRHGEIERWATAQREIAFLLTLPDLVAARAQSMPEDRAIAMVAAETGVALETVQVHWRHGKKRRAEEAREKRNREIMRLAARGWTNGAIAGRLDLHPSTVARIIQKTLRATAAIAAE